MRDDPRPSARSAIPGSTPPVRWREADLVLPLALLAVVLAAQFAAILWLNGGRFVYSFDDPYVHLALAERLAGGHYGINPGEPASPSSSILWPFLLVPLARTVLGAWVPLVLNLAAAVALVAVVREMVALAMDEVPAATRAKRGWIVAALLMLMNLPFLVFTGMEHTLHVLLTALGVLGMALEARDGRVRAWLPVAIVAGVMVRYEGLALGVAALAYLAARGHRRAAALTGLAMVLPLAGFTLFLDAQGLPLLPASVISKGGALAGHPGIRSFARLALANFSTLSGRTLWVALLLLVLAALEPRPRVDRLLAGAWAIALALALALVPFRGYGRYEAFAWCIASLGVAHARRAPLARAAADASATRVALVSAALVALLVPRFVATAAVTPRAANNIYLQHVQMHRFATEWWREPVAVNDLGRVAYQNPRYVLDLWGLGTPDALRERRRGAEVAWMDRLARRHGVRLAMIYKHWFPALPAGWTQVATLTFDGPVRTPDARDVAIYALDAASAERARRVLRAFERTLPPGARVVWRNEGVQTLPSPVPAR